MSAITRIREAMQAVSFGALMNEHKSSANYISAHVSYIIITCSNLSIVELLRIPNFANYNSPNQDNVVA